MNLASQTLSDTVLQLENQDVWILGPGLTLTRSTINASCKGNNLIFNEVTMNDCAFSTTKKLSNVDWTSVKVIGCRMLGVYEGCDFGHRPPPDGDSDFGEIARCDFGKAKLNYCRFFNCNLDILKLPPWPSFSITNMKKAAQDFKKSQIKERGTLDLFFQLEAELGQVAATFDARLISREYGVSAEDLQQVLSKKNYVIM